MERTAPTPRRKRVNTQERLRTAASRIFARQGVAGTSIDALCDAAGFSRGAFYSNYLTKYDLALEVLAEGQAAEIATWQDVLRETDDLDGAIVALVGRFDVVATRTNWGLLNVELQLEAERDVDFAARYQLYLETLYLQTREMISALSIRAGRQVPENVREIAMAVRCFSMGLMLQSRRSSTMPTLSSPGQMVMSFLRGALLLDRPEATTG